MTYNLMYGQRIQILDKNLFYGDFENHQYWLTSYTHVYGEIHDYILLFAVKIKRIANMFGYGLLIIS